MSSFYIPSSLEQWIELRLNDLGTSLLKPQTLARSIKRMADFYVENPTAPTPWQESWCQEAQLAYYFPLNFLRNLRVFQELKKLHFFNQPLIWHEFGVGLAPSLEAFAQCHAPQNLIQETRLIETSTFAKTACSERLQTKLSSPPRWLREMPRSLPKSSFLMMSYSLTELDSFPEWSWEAHSIVIIEPSTREDGRRLMDLREMALERGFKAVAPCTHSLPCPLLVNSQRDWCHDRIALSRPAWMLAIEEFLPFSNPTLTLSYLALERSEKPNPQYSENTCKARVVGDLLEEKGKTRQLICRNSEREFLSFLKKDGPSHQFKRGDIIELIEPITKKGEELRPQSTQVKALDRQTPDDDSSEV